MQAPFKGAQQLQNSQGQDTEPYSLYWKSGVFCQVEKTFLEHSRSITKCYCFWNSSLCPPSPCSRPTSRVSAWLRGALVFSLPGHLATLIQSLIYYVYEMLPSLVFTCTISLFIRTFFSSLLPPIQSKHFSLQTSWGSNCSSQPSLVLPCVPPIAGINLPLHKACIFLTLSCWAWHSPYLNCLLASSSWKKK